MKTAGIIAFLIILSMIAAYCWPDGEMISRDLGCERIVSSQGKNICIAISKNMEWTWEGHAIISPGWRPTWTAIARVYCSLQLDEKDIPDLKILARSNNWRLSMAADDLIRLVKSRDGSGEIDIFNPKSSRYILKNGCK